MTSTRRRAFPRAGRIAVAVLILLGAAAIAQAERRPVMKVPNAQLEPIAWAQIDGWADDDHDAAFATFIKSCKAILAGTRASRPGRPMYAALHDVCRKAVEIKPHKPGEARAFFEQNFRPVRISPLGDPDGFLTGYYEPIVEGMRKETDGYDYPLYRKPPGLGAGGRMAVTGSVSHHGKKKKKIRRRRFVSFHDRAAIEDGALAGRNLEICWLKDPIDAFFAHIQGSVRVRLDDGETLRLNYQAANGHPYVAVGRFLIERNIVSKDEMSMDRIREWMERNPEEGKALRRRNKSYVFFRETNLSSNDEPVGAQGISLSPGRSIAVDHRLHVYGTPFFISAMLPIDSMKPETSFRRLMIAQDTGGAIIGPARADIYFGAGDEAGSVSGRLRHPGRFVMLLPKSLAPSDDDGPVPLPRPRPPMLVADTPAVAKPDAATGEVRKQEIRSSDEKKSDPPPPRREASADPGMPASKAMATKKTEPKKPEPKKLESKKPEPKKAARKNSAPKNAEAKNTEAKKAEVKKTEHKKSAHKKTDSNDADGKSARNRTVAREAMMHKHDVGGAAAQPAEAKPAKKRRKH